MPRSNKIVSVVFNDTYTINLLQDYCRSNRNITRQQMIVLVIEDFSDFLYELVCDELLLDTNNLLL